MTSPIRPSGVGARVKTYTPHYQELCFQSWYAAGRPNAIVKILDVLPEDEYGRKPSPDALRSWRNEQSWDVRADELDVRANAIVEDELVNSRVLMLKEQASRARELQTMGLTFLREEGFDSSASAVAAVIKGAGLERESKGLSEAISRMLKMDDTELTNEVQRLLAKVDNQPEIIDAEEVDDSETPDEDDDVEDA